ncbi:hypothetical protein MMC30_001321 [Trapelia coarctata]|nr:hypothetical protein [Trapelia coarctata]
MSLDPWASYTGKEEDVSDNPWASPISDPIPAVGSATQDAPRRAETFRNTHNPQQHLQRDSGQGNRKESKAETGPWADLHSLQQDVWGDVQPTCSSSPAWPTHPPLEPGAQIYAPKLLQDPPPMIRDEDDFGDFEEPDLQPSVTDIETPAPELRTSMAPSGQEGVPKETFTTMPSITHPQNQIPEPDQYDPWAGLESFEKLSIPGIQRSTPGPSGVKKANPQITTSESPAAEVLWDADDWGFSPDPINTSKSGQDDKNAPLVKPRMHTITQATSASHVPPREATSKPPSAIPPTNQLPPPWDTDEWEPFSPDPNEAPALSSGDQFNIPPNSQPPPITRPLHPSQPSSTNPKSETPANPPKPNPSKAAALPPTNIPPPSILLTLLTSLVSALPTQVRTISPQPHAPTSLSRALHNCLSSLRVAARILAGRRLRWKRSPHLSQSMSIGPSHSGKPGGMKLSSVDKTETKREDREAAEFVRVWKGNLGSIRAALAEASGKVEGQPLTLPEIGEGMSVRVLKAEGMAGKSSVCFLCGLKREERVGGVDGDVLDGWGEWWVEFWGHVECQRFWDEHERFLQRRG